MLPQPSTSMIAFALLLTSGCRAIGKIDENRNSIAARRMSRQGIQAMQQGKADVAEQLFTDALDLSETDDRAHRGMAESLWRRNHQVAAIAHMENAVELSAGDPKLILRLGEMYHDVGRILDANEKSKQALDADPTSAHAWALRGRCLFATRKYEQALAAYHQALALKPDFAEAQFQAAEIYLAQGRFDRLLATLDCSLEFLPEEQMPARANVLRGIAFRELGRSQDALKCLQRAVVKDPQDVQTQLLIAGVCLQNGNLDVARESIEIANQLNPELVRQGGWYKQLSASEHRLASAESVSRNR